MSARRWLVPGTALVLAAPSPELRYAAVGAAVAAAGAEPIVLSALARRRAQRALVAAARTGAVVLGADPSGRPVTLSPGQLGAHALVLGASGAGKSTTLLRILGDHVARGGAAVALDLKGSPAFAATLAAAAAESGRPLVRFGIDDGAFWNPLAHGNATELKDKLMATERFSEPHYARAAERALQTVLQVLLAAEPDRRPSLDAVVGALDGRTLGGLLGRIEPELRERVRDYLAGLTPDQRSASRGIATRLAIMDESQCGPRLADPPAGQPGGPGDRLDLRAALRGEQVALFSLDAARYGKLAAQLGTLAIQDLVTATGDRLGSVARSPVLVALDEFSALGADHVVQLLARGREAGVSVVLATQELADLDRAARGLRDQVLGNTAVKIAHRQDVPTSARVISELIGSERVWEESARASTRTLAGGRRVRGPGTRRLVERARVAPDEIARLGTGEALLLAKIPRAAHTRVLVAPPPRRAQRDGGRLSGG